LVPQALTHVAAAAGLGRLHMAVPARRAGLSALGRRESLEWLCLYDHGMVYQPRRDGPILAHWAGVERICRLDVRRYRAGMPAGIDHQTSLILPGGHELWLTGRFPDVEAVTSHIVSRVTAARLPLLATAIRAGGVVDFGPLSLHADRIGFDGRYLNWIDVTAVGIYKGKVTVVGRGLRRPWASVPAHGLPNLALLLALTRRLRAATDQ
jgi:hypothetical protein